MTQGVWKGGNLTVGPAVDKQIYEIIGPTGKSFFPPKGYCWRFTKKDLKNLERIIVFGLVQMEIIPLFKIIFNGSSRWCYTNDFMDISRSWA